jgi:LDH2 family malate/lactate/ureidoglycolate dehydrogenase
MRMITASALTDMTQAILTAEGTPPDIARQVAVSLVTSNLLGHDSHGVLRLARYVNYIRTEMIQPAARPTVAQQSEATAVVDGAWGFGQTIAQFGTSVAAELARAHGVGAVSLTRTNHIGRLGEYAEMLANESLVGMVITSGSAFGGAVSAYGGSQRIFGTNPIAFAVPVDEEFPPLVVDFATSGVAEGKVAVALSKGARLAPGLLLDKDGAPSTSPASFYEGGALIPFGGHKGYGLALMIEILASIMTGVAPGLSAEWTRSSNPTLITAWDPTRFVPLDQFRRQTAELCRYIHNSRPAEGFEQVLLPGEPEARSRAVREREGIPLPDTTWKELSDLASSHGIEVPDLPTAVA